MLAQSVYALSAPCPMLHDHASTAANTLDQSDHHMNHGDMDHSGMNHSSMMEMTETDTCCGDETCPMNTCVSAVLIQTDAVTTAIQVDFLQPNPYRSSYLSVQSNNLYRPPISL